MRIVCINGVQSPRATVWTEIASALSREIPEASLAVEEALRYLPWEVGRMRAFTDDLVARYDDGADTLLVGHSMGGVIACAMTPRMKRSRILGIVTVFSPHRFMGGMFSRALGAPERLSVPIVTFRATRDALVWWGSKHPQAEQHTVLDCNHRTELTKNRAHAEAIARAAKGILASGA